MAMYDNFAKTFSESRKNLKWPEIEEILKILKKENFTKILDVGCGNGRFLQNYFEKNGNFPEKYLGVDASKNMILEAKEIFEKNLQKNLLEKNQENSEINFEVCEMQNLQKIGNQKFDAIIFLASFHHLQSKNERIEVLQKAKNLLEKNGKIFLTNWNLINQEKYKNSHIGNSDFEIKIGEFVRFYHGFEISELNEIFENSGFIVEKNEIFENNRNIFSILKI